MIHCNPNLINKHHTSHDDVIKWKHFPRYWPFVRGIHRSPLNYPHKGQWREALKFSLICARINSWGWWFETLSCSLWRHCNAYKAITQRWINKFWECQATGHQLAMSTHASGWANIWILNQYLKQFSFDNPYFDYKQLLSCARWAGVYVFGTSVKSLGIHNYPMGFVISNSIKLHQESSGN